MALSGLNIHNQNFSKSSGNIFGGSTKASGSSSVTQVASNLLGANVTLDAGKNVTLQASNLGAANDAALIARGGDVQLLDAQNVTSSWSKSSRTGFGIGGGGDFLSFYGTESKKQTNVNSNSAGSQMATNNSATVTAGRDVVMVGANVRAGGDLGVSAGRDVNILAGENTTYSNTDKKTQAAGVGALFSLEKIDLFAGYQTTASGRTERSSTAQSSVLAAGGDMNVSAGNNINVEAGKFAAGNDLNMTAANDLNLLQGEDTRSASEYKSRLRAGLNLTLQQNLTSNARKTYESAARTVDGSQNALGTGASAAETGMNAASTVNSSARASLTLGVSGENSSRSARSSTAVPSELFAGHDAALTAGNDVNMEGARLAAGNDATLTAGRDINIHAATSTASGSGSTSSFSAGAGLGAQASATGGASYGLTAKAALAAGEAKNSSTTRHNAEITAGGVLKTVSGRDTTISGANLLGDQVDMRAGRNLRVESVKDRAQSSSRTSSANVTGTIGFGGASVSGGANYATSDGSSDFIGRQTSIIGVNGVNIYTENNTHIKGAIIAALNDNLTLNTGTLSFEDMRGRQTSSSWSMGITGRWTPDSPAGAANANDGPSSDRPVWLQNLVDRQKELNMQWEEFKDTVIFAPGTFSYSNSEIERTARATVGQGAIIVRDNPGMDLSGLNRDTSKALTEETIRNTSFTLDPLFGHVDAAFSVTGKIGDGYDFAKNPGGYIENTWDRFLERVKETWNIGGKAKENPEDVK
jgi:filamentous hemagglutinin